MRAKLGSKDRDRVATLDHEGSVRSDDYRVNRLDPQRVSDRTVNNKILNACFVVIALTPYTVLPSWILIPVLIVLSAACAYARIRSGIPLPEYWTLVILIIVSGLYSAQQVADWDYFVRQINHYVQFIFLFPTFYYIVKYSDWLHILRKKWMLVGLLLCVAVDTLGYLMTKDDLSVHTISLSLLLIFVRSYANADRINYRDVLWTGFLAVVLTAVSSRATILIVVFAYPLLLIFPVRGYVVKAASFALLVSPAITYQLLSKDVIASLMHFDFNTAIRVEFIQSAWGYYSDNLLTGVGFDFPYRNKNVWHVVKHGLLTDDFRVNMVSNHNSFFDLGLRLGIISSVCMVILCVIRPGLGRFYRYKSLVMLYVCLSLGSNASLEDQRELPALIFALALLNGGKAIGRSERAQRSMTLLRRQRFIHFGDGHGFSR